MSTALVTGGSRGIGRSIVEALHAAGYKVAFTYASNPDAAAELQTKLGENALAFQADVKDFDRAVEVIEAAKTALGPITVLVNNAGIRKDVSLARMTQDQWRDVIDTNLTGVFNYSRNVIGGMMRTGGSIVNVTSVSGVIGMAGQANYSASKAGVIGFTRALAKEVARFEVRVNAIAPGFIDTDMTSSMDEATRKKLYAGIPAGRAGTADEVAKLALYLASSDSAYVTGQVWNMDGGLS
ncbi:MAG: SDR family oxidoreductase [Acidobacteriia bacterium]|jgi:3-oxoacyl-[acyl-carrier protein] reductase|nr:SDR family oxidoreductase [Terriglobia bacterium]